METHQIEWAPLDKLELDPDNANTHPTDNMKAIEDSLQDHGQVVPLLVQRSRGRVIHGNGRLEQMRTMGWTECQVIYLDIDDDEFRRLAIRMNRSAELAVWNQDVLAKQLAEIVENQEDVSIESMGWSTKELQAMQAELDRLNRQPTESESAPEAPKVAISKMGEVYQLGKHTLVCGDSTMPKYFPEGEADYICTDPPYGVGYESAGRREAANRPGSDRSENRQHDKIANDSDPDAAIKVMKKAFRNAFNHCKKGGCWYVACAPGPMLAQVGLSLQEMDEGLWRHNIVWVKSSLVFGRSDRHYQHEAFLYGWKTGAGHDWIGGYKRTSVMNHPRPSTSDEHPTMKPVGLIQELLECHPPGVVLDMFGGSGTTMIAADLAGHTAYLIEFEPKYCDVIRRRWHRYATENGLDVGDGLE